MKIGTINLQGELAGERGTILAAPEGDAWGIHCETPDGEIHDAGIATQASLQDCWRAAVEAWGLDCWGLELEELREYKYRSDSESGTVQATDLQEALHVALDAVGITGAMLADGASLWVEDQETGERISL